MTTPGSPADHDRMLAKVRAFAEERGLTLPDGMAWSASLDRAGEVIEAHPVPVPGFPVPLLSAAPRRRWSVGFLLDEDDARGVVLIRKNRPEWQAGMLNGVGGKAEPGEEPLATMRREFLEETGVEILLWEEFAQLSWTHDLDVVGPQLGVVHFFRAFAPAKVLMECAPGLTDEVVEVHDVHMLGFPGEGRKSVLPNLQWLVPLAAHRADRYEVIEVVEQSTTLRKVGRAT